MKYQHFYVLCDLQKAEEIGCSLGKYIRLEAIFKDYRLFRKYLTRTIPVYCLKVQLWINYTEEMLTIIVWILTFVLVSLLLEKLQQLYHLEACIKDDLINHLLIYTHLISCSEVLSLISGFSEYQINHFNKPSINISISSDWIICLTSTQWLNPAVDSIH